MFILGSTRKEHFLEYYSFTKYVVSFCIYKHGMENIFPDFPSKYVTTYVRNILNNTMYACMHYDHFTQRQFNKYVRNHTTQSHRQLHCRKNSSPKFPFRTFKNSRWMKSTYFMLYSSKDIIFWKMEARPTELSLFSMTSQRVWFWYKQSQMMSSVRRISSALASI